MLADSIKSRARHASWKSDEESKWDHLNPFMRKRMKRREKAIDEEQARASASASRDREVDLSGPDTYPPPAQQSTFGSGSPSSTTHSTPVDGAAKEYYTAANDSQSTTLNGDAADGISRPRKAATGLRPLQEEGEGNADMEKSSSYDDMDDAEKKKRKHHEMMSKKIPVVQQIKTVLFPQWLTINWLLIMAPVGIGLSQTKVEPLVIFIINFIAIIPLAGILSFATEEIALRVGEVLGGLLNATFGNAVELIVGIIALVHKEIIIVQTSLIGSILSNLLLVLGMCFFFGGVNRLEQFFNITVAQTAASILALAVGSLLIPTAFTWGQGAADVSGNLDEQLSHGTAIILLLVYGAYLFFQLKSHREMYNAPSQKVEKRKRSKKEDGETFKAMAHIGGVGGATAGGHANVENNVVVPDEEPEEPTLSLIGALVTLALATTLIGVCAEFLVDSISEVTCKYHVSEYFVGLILLPIVGNAAEHATAVTVAIKDKMDLAIGVAVGSSMQIALLVLPLMVILGWIIGADMTLVFDDFQIVVLFVAVILVNYLIGDGKSHWLEGILLMSLYIIIALAAWFYPKKNGQCPNE